jgi:uncharacterized protein (DUF2141 family)
MARARRALWALLPVLALLAFAAKPAEAARIEVEVTGIKAAKGTIRVSLYTARDWLDDKGLVAKATAKAAVPNARVVFENVAPGRYGIALIHDEDDDGDMTYTFLGLPAEGFGFSNNVRPVLSAPDFDDAAFDLKEPGAKLVIALVQM